MTVKHVEVLVEEPSAEAALQALLPRILGELSFRIYPHTCKDDLLKRLPERLRGYARWRPLGYRIVVVVDRDNDDALHLLGRLESMACEAGLTTRASGGATQVVVRLAIEELEAWFFGDWEAVCAAYPKVDPNIPLRARYRDPDAIQGGTWEALERVLQKAGYFPSGLLKIEAARAIAQHMDPWRNRSASFQALRDALAEACPPPEPPAPPTG